jgi:hypothetical protein
MTSSQTKTVVETTKLDLRAPPLMVTVEQPVPGGRPLSSPVVLFTMRVKRASFKFDLAHIFFCRADVAEVR